MIPEAAPTARMLLGPEGPFSRDDGYELREGQLVMADAVARALQDATVLLCEAGTGTGKTLAYLVPAILSGQRVVISTATKALQDQIVLRDVPRLFGHMPDAPRVAVAKGLSNYLCRRRFEEARRDPTLARGRSLALVEQWARSTSSGDIAELADLPETDSIWADVVSSSDTRVGAGCPHHDECFVTRMKQQLSAARIIVVNHHLFFADLALKSKATAAGAARAGVLPPYDAVIFDEAHRVEDVASAFFGVRVSTAKVASLVRDANRTFRASLPGEASDRGGRLLEAIRRASATFFAAAARFAPKSAEGRAVFGRDSLDPTDHEAHRMLDDALETVETFAETHATNDAMEVVRRRAAAARQEIAAVVDPATHHVAWIEARHGHVSIGASLTDVGPVFRDLVVGRLGGVVLTSATLASVAIAQTGAAAGQNGAGAFSFLKSRLGLDEGVITAVEELAIGSPFDYETSALLYVPRDLPDVAHPGFLDAAAERVAELVSVVGGGAFVLTTSLRAMRSLGASLERATGRQVYVQGSAPKSVLLDNFREHGDAVLVATMGFWEGVDVPGNALRMVIVDKLPFAVPTDALVAARCAKLAAEGLDPFASYSVPDATILLKQGVGRLLRSRRDRGIVAVLDHRLTSRAYGRKILERLPLVRRTETMEDVREFWDVVSGSLAR